MDTGLKLELLTNEEGQQLLGLTLQNPQTLHNLEDGFAVSILLDANESRNLAGALMQGALELDGGVKIN